MGNSNKDQTRIILDSIADGVFTVDQDWKITSFNRAAESITGIRREEALNRQCWDVLRASICENACALRHTMETGEPVANKPLFIVSSAGERIPVSISTALLKDGHGDVIGGVESFRDLSLVEQLRKELEGRHSFFDIISKNDEMHRLFGILEQVAESSATVLLVGESGTGKELFAKAIHALSPRKNGPLMVVNCAALPDNLLESELFGYKAGAFTDAKKDKPGRLALAEGGTLFLDEIGDISPALQVKLLRVLQDRIYEPLGATRSLKADVRIVAATNTDLEAQVQQGTFRKDLYYRIHVVKLSLPPLRERKEDIPLLADHFLKRYNHLNGKNIQGLSPEVYHILMSHSFPGNIRELENIIEYATLVCKDMVIGPEHLPDHLSSRQKREDTKGTGPTTPPTWDDMERIFLLDALQRNKGNRKETAAELGIHPSTLWRKMKRLNLDPDRQDP